MLATVASTDMIIYDDIQIKMPRSEVKEKVVDLIPILRQECGILFPSVLMLPATASIRSRARSPAL